MAAKLNVAASEGSRSLEKKANGVALASKEKRQKPGDNNGGMSMKTTDHQAAMNGGEGGESKPAKSKRRKYHDMASGSFISMAQQKNISWRK